MLISLSLPPQVELSSYDVPYALGAFASMQSGFLELCQLRQCALPVMA
jgi:hypothetical protein